MFENDGQCNQEDEAKNTSRNPNYYFIYAYRQQTTEDDAMLLTQRSDEHGAMSRGRRIIVAALTQSASFFYLNPFLGLQAWGQPL